MDISERRAPVGWLARREKVVTLAGISIYSAVGPILYYKRLRSLAKK